MCASVDVCDQHIYTYTCVSAGVDVDELLSKVFKLKIVEVYIDPKTY